MARLIATEGPLTGQVFEIDPGLTLGREKHNDVALLGSRHASRDHAKVWKDGANTFAIADLGSTNGTLVNDDKITRRPLSDGDEIRIGDAVFRFELGEVEKPKPRVEQASERLDLAAVLRGEVAPSPVKGSLGRGETADSIEIQSRVLQYRKKKDGGGILQWDMSQLEGERKWLMLLIALGIAVGLFFLIKSLVPDRQPPEERPPIEAGE